MPTADMDGATMGGGLTLMESNTNPFDDRDACLTCKRYRYNN
jgi:hypothetical protein